jgi:hypothetical protein
MDSSSWSQFLHASRKFNLACHGILNHNYILMCRHVENIEKHCYGLLNIQRLGALSIQGFKMKFTSL